MKVCSICKENKPLSEFAFQNKSLGKVVSACKVCSNNRQRLFRKENPEIQRM